MHEFMIKHNQDWINSESIYVLLAKFMNTFLNEFMNKFMDSWIKKQEYYYKSTEKRKKEIIYVSL